ncbi:hypothetical protein [Limnobacter sp.]|uniref:hypothetical protein n=1 Tax=Limnobacter sp. TaxID=2003368 RepID=UPI003518DC51
MRRVTVSAMLLFALLFQSLAQAMPCCDEGQGMGDRGAIELVVSDASSQDANDPCTVASPVCCAVPSLIHADVPFKSLAMAAVHVPTVHPLALNLHPSSPDRPPRG